MKNVLILIAIIGFGFVFGGKKSISNFSFDVRIDCLCRVLGFAVIK